MQSSYLIHSCIRFLGDAFREQTPVENKDFSSAPAPHVAAGVQGKPPAPDFTHAVADVCKCTKD